MELASIPVVDLRDHGATATRAAFVRTLGEGLEAHGFVAVTGHGIPQALLGRAYGLAAEMFGLPSAIKRGYETPHDGRQRGYTSFGVEHAKHTDIPDLKEFWHVGRGVQDGWGHDLPHNVFPTEVPAAATVFQDLFDRMEDFALRLLDGLGEYLALPPATFRDLVTDGNSVLRVIHYPELAKGAPAGAIRAAAHEDINLLTVLPASTRPGLELQTRQGDWVPVQTPPDVMVCDTGDMMALLTAGRIRSTTHRVVNPQGADGGRFSMPFFLHPHPDAVLAPAVDGYCEPVRTRDYLLKRLMEIGVA